MDKYWAAQHKVVRDAMVPIMGSGDVAWTTGRMLAMQGYVIDPAIMVLGWNPVLVMQTRLADRLPFTQSLSREPLPGRIPSSINADDYPSVDQPMVPVVNLAGIIDMVVVRDRDGNVVSSTPNLLWTVGGKNYFAPGPGCYGPHGVAVVDGKSYLNPDDGTTFTADVKQDMMGLFRVFMTTLAG